jgi:predicted component of type VI protein secretion system
MVDVPVAKNLKALQGALEHSLTIQRVKVQEIVDELVTRGTLSRAEADRLLNRLVASSKDYSQALLTVLDTVSTETRKTLGAGLEAGLAPVMATAGKLVETVKAAPKLVAKAPKASKTAAPKAPAAKPVAAKPAAARPAPSKAATNPIADYDDLTVAQLKPKLAGLTPDDLRRVRTAETAGKRRKGVLDEIAKHLKD